MYWDDLMATSVFNLSAVDRIEADVVQLLANDKAMSANLANVISAIASLTATLNDLVLALGGGDQPAIDAAAAQLRTVHDQLVAATARDKAP
jgi:hypothetical protein